MDQTHFTLPPLRFGAISITPLERAPSITPFAHAQPLTYPARIHTRLYPVPDQECLLYTDFFTHGDDMDLSITLSIVNLIVPILEITYQYGTMHVPCVPSYFTLQFKVDMW